ncbi:MAG: ABC transporter permease subunit [Opitutales bacterium]
MKRMTFSLDRVSAIARNTFLEAVRQKLFHFLVIIAIGIIASSQFFREFDFGASELKFITDFGFGAIVFFGSILSIVATAQLFFSEIENKTALTILAKPLLRSEFIIGKFLGVFLVLLVFTLVMTIVLAALLFWREMALIAQLGEAFDEGERVLYGDLFLYGLVQWLKFGIMATITMVVASFSNTNLYTVILSFFILIICHIQYLAREAWADIAFLPVQLVVWLVGFVFPNFQLFNIADQVALGQSIPMDIVGRIVAYGLIYVAVFNFLAIYSFRKREI